MKIFYSSDTDSVSIKLRTGEAGVVGEIMGEDLNENVVLHRDDAGTLYEIEVVGSASKAISCGVRPYARLTRSERRRSSLAASPISSTKHTASRRRR